MSKIKSNRSIRRRFRRTKTGKWTRTHANRRHLLSHRTTKRKRQLGRTGLVHDTQTQILERLLPY